MDLEVVAPPWAAAVAGVLLGGFILLWRSQQALARHHGLLHHELHRLVAAQEEASNNKFWRPPGGGTTVYVHPSGDDGNVGGVGGPVRTIARALNLLYLPQTEFARCGEQETNAGGRAGDIRQEDCGGQVLTFPGHRPESREPPAPKHADPVPPRHHHLMASRVPVSAAQTPTAYSATHSHVPARKERGGVGVEQAPPAGGGEPVAGSDAASDSESDAASDGTAHRRAVSQDSQRARAPSKLAPAAGAGTRPGVDSTAGQRFQQMAGNLEMRGRRRFVRLDGLKLRVFTCGPPTPTESDPSNHLDENLIESFDIVDIANIERDDEFIELEFVDGRAVQLRAVRIALARQWQLSIQHNAQAVQ